MQEYLGFSGNTERIRKDVLKLSLKDQIEEFMYLGLRMTEGISEIDFEQNFGQKLENIYGSVLQKYTPRLLPVHGLHSSGNRPPPEPPRKETTRHFDRLR